MTNSVLSKNVYILRKGSGVGTAASGRREVEALQTEYLKKGDWPKTTIS